MAIAMKLHQVRDFIAIAESASIRKAAKVLGLSQPALTKSLHRLEDEMHVQLFARTARGVELTPYGEVLLVRARLIEAESERARQELAQMRGEREGTVTVGVSPTVATSLLPNVLMQFRKDYPNVGINIVGGLYYAHLPELRAGTMDFAVGPVPAGVPNFEFASDVLFYNSTAIACRKGHSLRNATRLAELEKAEWILYGPSRGGPGASIIEAFQDAGLPPPRVMAQCNSIAGLVSVVARTDILCVLPRQMLDQEPLCNGLHVMPIAQRLPRYPIVLMRKSTSPLTPVASHLATLLRRQVAYLNLDGHARPAKKAVALRG
ncbi:MAG: LysR family transcriptional regulator [Betaproteobacteria bacterium]|nr:MAG: LysR family transcriptional regulator [Betaproteobacteria bacterium]